MKIGNAVAVLAIVLLASPAAASIELVSNGNFNAGNTGFSSTYRFVPAPAMSTTPGDFAIRSSTTLFNAVQVPFTDHTGDVGGLMMLVDGLSNSTVAWEETVAVIPNTNYTFSAWASSQNSLNLPTLQFHVGGSQLGANFPLPAATFLSGANWQQYSQSWNSGANTSVTLAIYDLNASPQNAGNDFALDDISFLGPDAEGGAVPEPASLFAWGGLALIGVTAVILRRRK